MSKKRRKSGGYEDITSYSKSKGLKNGIKYKWKYKIKPFFLRNQKKNLKALLSIFICLLLVGCAFGGAYVRKLLSLINYNDGVSFNPDITFANDEYNEDELLSFQAIGDISYADDLKGLLKSWATNGGEKLYSKNVVNVLLIGEDNEQGSHRSDSTILASINLKTKKITLVSFLRDSYTYMDINGSERYDKVNHSYSWGGAATLMKTISDDYKIKIDHYVSINYESFVAAIDALGGVDVPITESEAKYMNRTTRVKGFESGDSVHLDGQRALIYARIRHLDSEVERTRRQRDLITALINSVKNNPMSVNDAIEKFLPYVTTNYTSKEILSLGTKALSDGWLNFDIVSAVEPSEDFRLGKDGFRTYTGYLFVWIVDYIQAARELQNMLYNQTNIVIDPETHISAIKMAGGTYSSSSYDDDTGEEVNSSTHYYEESDFEETTKRGNLFNFIENGISRPSLTLPNQGDEDETTADYWEETYTTEALNEENDATSYNPFDFDPTIVSPDYQESEY